MQITQHPSPNFGERREGAKPDLIVLHYTAMTKAAAALDRLCDPTCEVSAHYLIGSDGQVIQMVQEDMRAWHAGAGAWGACTDVNSRSIGIELANNGQTPFAAAQMDALEILMAGIMDRWSIRPERVIAHSDMAPSRKGDPGRRFDWERLAKSNLSVWPTAQDPAKTSTFRTNALKFGYPATDTDDQLLDAFRQRFRPWATDALDAKDAALAADLAARFPVDQTPTST